MFGPQAAYFAELFPPQRRFAGFAFARELGSLLAGGPAPFVADRAGGMVGKLVAGGLLRGAALGAAPRSRSGRSGDLSRRTSRSTIPPDGAIAPDGRAAAGVKPVAQQLRILQSLWAMERRRADEPEWPLQTQLAMIRDAGFDGAGVRFIDPAFATEVTGFLRAHGMIWQAQCYPTDVDDLKPVLELVARLGADHVNLQPNVRPHRIERMHSAARRLAAAGRSRPASRCMWKPTATA